MNRIRSLFPQFFRKAGMPPFPDLSGIRGRFTKHGQRGRRTRPDLFSGRKTLPLPENPKGEPTGEAPGRGPGSRRKETGSPRNTLSSLMTSSSLIFAGIASALLLLGGCPLKEEEIRRDIRPPVFERLEHSDSRKIGISFNEAVRYREKTFRSRPVLTPQTITARENRLEILLGSPVRPGMRYTFRLTVEDRAGNSLGFLFRFYGHNGAVPDLLINEFNPEGTGNNPEVVELYARSAGNLGGLTFYRGLKDDFEDSFIFPAVTVQKGEFILLHTHWDPARYPKDIRKENESGPDKTRAQARLSSDKSRDFWTTDLKGLSATNGVISLYDRPNGVLLDAVIYTNRTDRPAEKEKGWTRSLFPLARALYREKGWKSAGGGTLILPSESLAVDQTSATRSFSRGSVPQDSNSPADWYIVPTGKSTFGAVNSDLTYP